MADHITQRKSTPPNPAESAKTKDPQVLEFLKNYCVIVPKVFRSNAWVFCPATFSDLGSCTVASGYLPFKSLPFFVTAKNGSDSVYGQARRDGLGQRVSFVLDAG